MRDWTPISCAESDELRPALTVISSCTGGSILNKVINMQAICSLLNAETCAARAYRLNR